MRRILDPRSSCRSRRFSFSSCRIFCIMSAALPVNVSRVNVSRHFVPHASVGPMVAVAPVAVVMVKTGLALLELVT
jgi:hypothetical protein